MDMELNIIFGESNQIPCANIPESVANVFVRPIDKNLWHNLLPAKSIKSPYVGIRLPCIWLKSMSISIESRWHYTKDFSWQSETVFGRILCLSCPSQPFYSRWLISPFAPNMMTSSNGNIFRVTGPLCGEFIVPGEFPALKPVTRSFDAFFDLCLNKQLSEQSWGWWFETPPCPLWRLRNGRRVTPVSIKFSSVLSLYVNCISNQSCTQGNQYPTCNPRTYCSVFKS